MIWCVEDDNSIREIELYTLNSTGFEAQGFEDGALFWNAIQKQHPDLVILDVMLPGIDGIELLRRMKMSEELSSVPVIMATAKGSEYDRIRGLELGADDYLVKPFSMLEMVSRVKAVLRRCKPKELSSLLCTGNLVLDTDKHTVLANGVRINLTYKEYELLRVFLSHPGTAFTREQLLSKIWDTEYVGETRTVDMHVRTLRQKLGDCGAMIETVRNVGYRLEAVHDT